MNIEQEREKLILFTKIGAIVLTSFALLATSFFVYPENRAVFNESLLHEKELPIYCVEKEKPQISIRITSCHAEKTQSEGNLFYDRWLD